MATIYYFLPQPKDFSQFYQKSCLDPKNQNKGILKAMYHKTNYLFQTIFVFCSLNGEWLLGLSGNYYPGSRHLKSKFRMYIRTY